MLLILYWYLLRSSFGETPWNTSISKILRFLHWCKDRSTFLWEVWISRLLEGDMVSRTQPLGPLFLWQFLFYILPDWILRPTEHIGTLFWLVPSISLSGTLPCCGQGNSFGNQEVAWSWLFLSFSSARPFHKIRVQMWCIVQECG